jgi:hypothetical protein
MTQRNAIEGDYARAIQLKDWNTYEYRDGFCLCVSPLKGIIEVSPQSPSRWLCAHIALDKPQRFATRRVNRGWPLSSGLGERSGPRFTDSLP